MRSTRRWKGRKHAPKTKGGRIEDSRVGDRELRTPQSRPHLLAHARRARLALHCSSTSNAPIWTGLQLLRICHVKFTLPDVVLRNQLTGRYTSATPLTFAGFTHCAPERRTHPREVTCGHRACSVKVKRMQEHPDEFPRLFVSFGERISSVHFAVPGVRPTDVGNCLLATCPLVGAGNVVTGSGMRLKRWRAAQMMVSRIHAA
jgi:hypothetical protein